MFARVLVLASLLAIPLARSAHAATPAQIDQAVQRGVQFLRGQQTSQGNWTYSGYEDGSTALVGLALLESGVRPGDPAIQAAAKFVRDRANTCTKTYSLSLMIFFLDRLGATIDEPLLHEMGERLRDGQLANGAWSYACPATTGESPVIPGLGDGDNSNTQFAVLGLWVARRHRVDVKDALERTDKYFRASQGQDGGWSYIGAARGNVPNSPLAGVPFLGTSSGAMTCAGLLGLIVQIGSQAALRAGDAKELPGRQPRKSVAANDPLKDPAVAAGMKCLQQFMREGRDPRLGIGNELYFLWSIERVGVAYGLKLIGPVDWYATGADRILLQQQANGSWPDHSADVGTSLALLFLKRANVASDLTRLVGGDAELRSGRDVEELKNAATASPKPAVATTLSASAVAGASLDRLQAALPAADARLQAAILTELRDRKGSEATQALVEAIASLEGAAADKARQFLAQRLERMTPATLARYLEVDDGELRRAASQAAAGKQDRTLIAPLLALLDDRDTAAADAAHAALVKLTGQQFGAFAGQSTVNRFLVIKKWRAWWETQGAGKP